jgi:hypothetical protein
LKFIADAGCALTVSHRIRVFVQSGATRETQKNNSGPTHLGTYPPGRSLKGEEAMRKKINCLLLLVTTLALVARMSLPVMAQTSPTGSIKGTVTDEQGAIITKATITVTNKATGEVRKVSAGDDGIYLVSTLPPAEYEVKIEAEGFSTQIFTTVIEVGKTNSGDVKMRTGSPNEIVNVESGATIIDKSSNRIEGVISRQKIDNLPLNGRNFLQLPLLEPGVTVSTSNPGDANNLFNVSFGGSDPDNTRITVDGGSVLDLVTGGAAQNFSTETIQEFQISSFNFDLSTGVTSTGAINIVSRTGTNDFHGSGIFFARDDQWAAVPTLRQGTPDFRRYQYGGSLGGPIKKDRAFFFGNIEALNQDSVFSTVTTGFSGFRQLDNNFGSPYDGLVVNARFDIPKFISDKNNLFLRYSYDWNDTFAPVTLNTFPSNWRANENRDHNAIAGVTTVFNPNFVNDLRFNYQRIDNDSTIPTEADCPSTNPGCVGRGGVQIIVLGSGIQLGNSTNAPQSRILNRYQTTDNVNWQKGAHRIRFGGEHEFNLGKGGWAFLDPALVVLHDPNNVFAVNAAVAAAPIPAPLKAALTIPLPAPFLNPALPLTVNDILQLPIAVAFIGIGDPIQPQPFNREIARRSHRIRFYGQDSWLVRPGLTLNFGASYMFETNLYNHDLAKPAFLAPLIGADNLAPSKKDKNNIGPALGFAWDVKNDGKTVIRGGSGIYYDTALFVTRLRERSFIAPLLNGRVPITGDFYRNTIPFAAVPFISALGPLNLINPAIGTPINFQVIPTKFTGANFLQILGPQNAAINSALKQLGQAGFTGIDFFKNGEEILDPQNDTPYTIHYNLGVARQLPWNMTVSADFVLRKAVHSQFITDYNRFNRATANGGAKIRKCANATEAIDPTVECSNGSINFVQHGNRNEYRALLVKLDKRFANRFQFTASYALAQLRGYLTGENLDNLFEDKVDLGGDARHSLVFSGIVELPWGIQASLISIYRSRGPFNARVPSTIDLNGDGTRGDTLPGLELNSLNRGTSKEELFRLVNEFNAQFAGQLDAQGALIPALALPTDFEFGDNFVSHDVRFAKNFKFGERVTVQGLVEVFNIFNTANLAGFSTTLDRATTAAESRAFGRATQRVGQAFGSGGPRAFQLGARVTF